MLAGGGVPEFDGAVLAAGLRALDVPAVLGGELPHEPDEGAAAGLRVELDDRQEKIGYKIREAQLQKIPYMLVTGDREVAEGGVSVRSRSAGDLGSRLVDAFVGDALDEIRTKRMSGPPPVEKSA